MRQTKQTKQTKQINNAIDLLQAFVRTQLKKTELLKKELGSLPEGSLYIAFRQSKRYFYHVKGKTKKGITNQMELVYKLARKNYVSLQIKVISENIENMIQMGNPSKMSYKYANRLSKALDTFTKAGLDMLRITCSASQYTWVKKPYIKNPKEYNGPKYKTTSGVLVRSKSELLIANALERFGVPYRYEMGFNLDVGWMAGITGAAQGRYKTYYPDFVIMTASGEFIIWEHLGRLDLEGYRNHNMEKFAAYRQGGLCAEEDLILTVENDIVDSMIINNIIVSKILPRI